MNQLVLVAQIWAKYSRRMRDSEEEDKGGKLGLLDSRHESK